MDEKGKHGMINIALRSEYSFKQTFCFLSAMIEQDPNEIIGVADLNNTYSHYKFEALCHKNSKAPLFGVRLMVVRDPTSRPKGRGQFGHVYVFIAKNHDGLKEIYELTTLATRNFFYRPLVGLVDVWKLSDNVVVIAESYELAERVDYLGISFRTPKYLIEKSALPKVAMSSHSYVRPEDREVFEIFQGNNFSGNTYPGHILTEKEWMIYFNDQSAVDNTYVIAEKCKGVKLKKATPIIYDSGEDIVGLCIEGAKKKGIDFNDPVYKNRFEHEMELIKSKGFVDYFLIVSDMVRHAKKTMLVGPGRGSAGGSLVCYLLDITAVDPIKYNLLFERFINPTRLDLPDIDVDFPDKYRHKVTERLTDKYGENHVNHLGLIATMKPRGTIRLFAKRTFVPEQEIDAVLTGVVTRSTGDVRFSNCIDDTLKETQSGRDLLEKYPRMSLCGRIEGHASNSGIHAAAMIVTNEELFNFAATDERSGAIMLEKSDTKINEMLKIDCLGLKTLTILQETAELAGFDWHEYYRLDFEDDNVFKQFREVNTRGIFQFEGYALQNLCRSIKVKNLDDISAINALSRPGPLHGGSTAKFAEMHSGGVEPEPIVDHPVVRKITDLTLGNLVYQEQIMELARDLAGLGPEAVAQVRKLVANRQGGEAFERMKEEFIKGATDNGLDAEKADFLWGRMVTFGSYGFNKSHSVAYGIISYWTAWAKFYYPTEFACSFLNNTSDLNDKRKLLREMTDKYKVKVRVFDEEVSGVKWEIHKGVIVGPYTNIKGIGVAGAKELVSCRNKGETPPPGLLRKLFSSENEMATIFPCRDYWGELWDDPEAFGLPYPPTEIEKVTKKGEYIIVGKLVRRNVRDLNEESNVRKRGGEVYETDTYLMNMTVEDDTDSAICRISRQDFGKLAKPIINTGREGIDWYLIKGNIISDEFRMFFVKSIYCLGDGITETIEDIR